VFYSSFDELQSWLGRRGHAAAPSAPPGAVPVAGD